jgi:hypothetical protein
VILEVLLCDAGRCAAGAVSPPGQQRRGRFGTRGARRYWDPRGPTKAECQHAEEGIPHVRAVGGVDRGGGPEGGAWGGTAELLVGQVDSGRGWEEADAGGVGLLWHVGVSALVVGCAAG